MPLFKKKHRNYYNQGFDLIDYVLNPEIFDNQEDGYINYFKNHGLGDVELIEEI